MVNVVGASISQINSCEAFFVFFFERQLWWPAAPAVAPQHEILLKTQRVITWPNNTLKLFVSKQKTRKFSSDDLLQEKNVLCNRVMGDGSFSQPQRSFCGFILATGKLGVCIITVITGLSPTKKICFFYLALYVQPSKLSNLQTRQTVCWMQSNTYALSKFRATGGVIAACLLSLSRKEQNIVSPVSWITLHLKTKQGLK